MVDGSENVDLYDESDDVVQQVHAAQRTDAETRMRDIRKNFSPIDVQHLERCKNEAGGKPKASRATPIKSYPDRST